MHIRAALCGLQNNDKIANRDNMRIQAVNPEPLHPCNNDESSTASRVRAQIMYLSKQYLLVNLRRILNAQTSKAAVCI